MKKLLLSLALVALVAAGCSKSSNNNSSDSNQDQNSVDQSIVDQNTNTPSDNTSTAPASNADGTGADAFNNIQVVGVTITTDGFSPATVHIKKGDYVQFTNQDSSPHWPASDPHPTHTGYPGFDAKKGLTTGGVYRFQFLKTGTFGYHDHLNPSLHGTVIVE